MAGMRLLLAWCVALWIGAIPSKADDTVREKTPAGLETDAAPPGDLELGRFHRVLGRNLTSNLLTKDNLLPLVVGTLGSLAIAPADQEISDAMRGHAPEFGGSGQVFNAALTTSFVGGSLIAGRLTSNSRFRSFSYTLAQAYATDLVLTHGLKYVTNRMRPDGTSSTSFPSGHTADTFAMATVVTNYYGKKWGIPFYAVAGLVGVSRIEKGRHWPTDVLAGAAVGYIAGKTAIRGSRRELGRGTESQLTVSALCGRTQRGISVRFRY